MSFNPSSDGELTPAARRSTALDEKIRRNSTAFNLVGMLANIVTKYLHPFNHQTYF